MFCKSDQSRTCPTLDQFCNTRLDTPNALHICSLTLKEKRQESNKEHKENGNDTTLDPLESWNKIVTASLPTYRISPRVHLTDRKHLVKSTKENHFKKSISIEVSQQHSQLYSQVIMNVRTERMTRILLTWNPG